MKLFGNTGSKKKKTGRTAPRYAEQPRQTRRTTAEPEKPQGGRGLLYALARKRIARARAALDTEEYRRRSPAERRKIEADVIKYQKRKVRNRLIVIIVILAVAIGAFVFYKSTVKPPDIAGSASSGKDSNKVTAPSETDGEDDGTAPNSLSSTRQKGMYTFLVIGNDQGNGNTDTMMVGRLDTVNNKLNIISIPRDTLVNVSWKVKKANTILAFKDEGLPGLVDGLSDVLGFKVDSYVSVDLDAFVELVNTIDGVDFDVPVNMDYDDPTQNLSIHIKAGMQHLTGEQAVGVVRFRHSYAAGDIQRISVQQDFMKALATKCLSFGTLATNITDYAKIFKKYVDTNLTVGNIVWYGQQMLNLTSDDITFETMPENYNDSVGGLSYCTILIDDWLTMLNADLNPYKDPVTEANLNILTRDENGNLYATTGSIAGGEDSFYHLGSSGSSSSSSSSSSASSGSSGTSGSGSSSGSTSSSSSSQSGGETTAPSEDTEKTPTPSEDTEESTAPSEGTQESTAPSESPEESTAPSETPDESTAPSESPEESMVPTTSGSVTSPSDLAVADDSSAAD